MSCLADPAGSGLAAPADPGDLVLSVDWAIDFTPDERRLLRIGSEEGDDETLAYIAVDDDTETLTLEAPGVVLSWDEGDPVTPLDATGTMPEETWTIDVDMGDGGDPLPCRPSHALQDKLREDEEYIGVRCEVDEGEVVTLLDKASSIQPSAIQTPMFIGHLAVNQSIPNGASYTDVEYWVVTELRGGMQDDGVSSVVVPISGYYSLASSALGWQANATGRRAVQPSFLTPDGVIGGGVNNQPGDGTVQQTTDVTTPIKRLAAGDSIKVTVWQTSGGSLLLIGDPDGAESFFCVEYRGPL